MEGKIYDSYVRRAEERAGWRNSRARRLAQKWRAEGVSETETSRRPFSPATEKGVRVPTSGGRREPGDNLRVQTLRIPFALLHRILQRLRQAAGRGSIGATTVDIVQRHFYLMGKGREELRNSSMTDADWGMLAHYLRGVDFTPELAIEPHRALRETPAYLELERGAAAGVSEANGAVEALRQVRAKINMLSLSARVALTDCIERYAAWDSHRPATAELLLRGDDDDDEGEDEAGAESAAGEGEGEE